MFEIKIDIKLTRREGEWQLRAFLGREKNSQKSACEERETFNPLNVVNL